jgi:hypothetical protein
MPEYDPPNAFYTQISLPEHISPTVFIGRDGFHLKRITELSQCEYLWMDFNRNVIEVWGRERRLPKALRMLQRRIDSFKPVDPLVATCDPLVATCDPLVDPTVRQWNESRFTVGYEVTGTEEACMKWYDDILKEYPHNPYFTKVKLKTVDENGTTVLTVTRANSCD